MPNAEIIIFCLKLDTTSKNMSDLIFIGVIIIFFLAAFSYLRFCEKLK